jgi:hypothetical protein
VCCVVTEAGVFKSVRTGMMHVTLRMCVLCVALCVLCADSSFHWHERERDTVSEPEGCADDEEHDADRGF